MHEPVHEPISIQHIICKQSHAIPTNWNSPDFWLSKPPKFGMSQFSGISAGKYCFKVIFNTWMSIFPGLFSANCEKISYVDLNHTYEWLVGLCVEWSALSIYFYLFLASTPMSPLGLMVSFYLQQGGGGRLEQWWKYPDFWFPNVGRFVML